MVGKAFGEGHYQNTGPHMRAGEVSPTRLCGPWEPPTRKVLLLFFPTKCTSNLLEPYYTLTCCSLK
jgi:hypothetical protein